jgi:hypothetical protein
MHGRLWQWGLLGALATGSAACAARSDGIYQQDVLTVLEGKGGMVADCVGQAQAAGAAAEGVVTVNFNVEADTGNFVNPSIDGASTTAPAPLQQCVIQSLAGLVLEPGDDRPANARYCWAFGSAQCDVTAPESAPAGGEVSAEGQLGT